MPEQEPRTYWGEKYRPFVPAWTNDEELNNLADAIVRRRAKIEHKVIPDLRKLIEAVHSAAAKDPNARLAPPRGQRGTDWKPPNEGASDALIALTIRGGEIIEAKCNRLDIRVTLAVHSHFSGGADFQGAAFSGGAYFRQAAFSSAAHFRLARFSASADFWRAAFSGRANFQQAAFSGEAHFGQATFAGGTSFGGATFSGEANFRWAGLPSGAGFWGAKFSAEATFDSITLERRLLFQEATFAPKTRLSFRGAYLRPGSEVSLPLARIRHEELRDWLTTSKNTWFDESDLGQDDHARRIWRWLVQYMIAAIIAPVVEIDWPWLRRTLGIASHGTFIKGEDSHDLKERLAAAADYNRLRDNFRHQASTDELEDFCHFRYMDLRRKAGDLWGQSHPWRLARWCAGAFYWLIWRNCCGYLVRPMRPLVTALLIMLICTGIYAAGASENTILFNGTLAEGRTAIDVWRETPMTPLYFSVTTFTTLGYGDFAPTGWFRLVAGLQAIFGVGLIALFTVSWGRKMIR